MSKTDRLFELIQLLRRTRKPVTAEWLAAQLEVNIRTIYRDVASLQGMRVPIDGEAGIGYIMRPGYDLPPLMFTATETEAIHIGLALLCRTGDRGLIAAAKRVTRKIADVLPPEPRKHFESLPHRVSDYGAHETRPFDLETLREAVRMSRKLRIAYRDADGAETRRTILPVAVFYYVKVITLAAWCELRQDIRNFRIDRIDSCLPMNDYFTEQADTLRRSWEAGQKRLPSPKD